MLAHQKLFDQCENQLMSNGELDEMLEKYGSVLGRAMITQAEILEDVIPFEAEDLTPVAYEISFDFWDTKMGIVVFPELRKPASRFWVTIQRKGSVFPEKKWITYFFKLLLDNIEPDGVRTPIFVFFTENGEMTLRPY